MAEGIVIQPAYVEKLAVSLRAELPNAEVNAEHVRGDRYRFVVVWPGFDDLMHPERQERVWEIADGVLEKQDLLKDSMILTLGEQDLPSE
jgi:hypothetical protein